MKFTKKLIALVSGVTLASLGAFAQEIISDPVGRIRLTVNGSIGWGFPGTTVLGAPLENAADARGVLTAVSGAILTDSTSAWVPGVFASTHYVQITSGPNVGITATVVGNTATQLTTAEDISSLLIGDESFVVRAYTTIADVFGAANESGLGSGSGANTADNVLIYNGSGYDFYYYQEGAASGGTGWRIWGDAFTDQSGVPIPIGAGILIKRRQPDDLDLFIAGNVLTTDAVVPVETGYNWLSGAHPIEYTLASYFGPDGGDLQKGNNVWQADVIFIPKDEGGFDIYYYREGAFFGGDGYRSFWDPFTDVSNAIIDVGEGFALQRKAAPYNQIDQTPLN